MAACCNDKACEIDILRRRQSGTLKVALAINAVMFAVEITAGVLAGSLALMADSLDMLGDALVYAFSLYVVARGPRHKAYAALAKSAAMAAFGLFVLGEAGWKLLHPLTPAFAAIGVVGCLALIANLACLTLLWRHRAEDINMRSVWLCSRNDIIANVSVLVAAAGVWATAAAWPDIGVGLALAALILRSAWTVLREALAALRHAHPGADPVI